MRNVIKRIKIGYAYLLLVLIFFVYMQVNISAYKKKYEINENEKKLTELQKEVDSLSGDINGVISIDILKEQYPELQLNDNVFYLEENDEKK